MVEVAGEIELFEDGAGGDTAFRGGCGLAAWQFGKSFGCAGVNGGLQVTPRRVDRAPVADEFVELGSREIRQCVQKEMIEMVADELAEFGFGGRIGEVF